MAAHPFAFPLLVVVLIPLIGLLLQKFLFAGIDAPPPDFGSGAMFDKIAPRYDVVNRVLALGMDLGWRRHMVRAIQESVEGIEVPRILDVATGTADVALLLAREIPRAAILGVDPSSKMLGVGRHKVREQQLESSIELQIADAQQLTGLVDSSFDAATMAFGIRNVPDRKKGLCEIHRVLKPHCRFCILEFSEPDESFGRLGRMARLFIRHVVPFLGSILSGAPQEYWHLQNSIKDFPSPKEFGEQLNSIECGGESSGASFELEGIVQMNFGSVQLYVVKTNKPDVVVQDNSATSA